MNNQLGIEKLLFHLSKHQDCYVVIGGLAARVLLEEKGLPFRETKDFDIVILADATKKEFSKDICNLLKEGKYKNAISNSNKVCYRFINPETPGYPKIIELFSYKNNKDLHRYLKKIDIRYDDEELSAIVLDEEVFNFIKKRKTIGESGIPVVDVLGLISLKTFAYFENLELYKSRKIKGRTNYLKHRNDIIRLLLSLSGNEKINDVPEIIKKRCVEFVEVLDKSKAAFKDINTQNNISLADVVSLYKNIYSI